MGRTWFNVTISDRQAQVIQVLLGYAQVRLDEVNAELPRTPEGMLEFNGEEVQPLTPQDIEDILDQIRGI
jgi:hypothetical protein